MKKVFISLLLLVFPLCVTFASCSSVNEFGLREAKDSNMVAFEMWGDFVVSTIEINRITLTGEEGSEFICSTSTGDVNSEGKFLLNTREDGTSVTVPSGSTVFWSCRDYDEEGMQLAQNDRIWLEFINQKDSHIIGYAVVRVDKISDYNYEPTVVKSVTFPKENGKYQAVTREQVAQLMKDAEQTKSEAGAFYPMEEATS